MKKKLLRKVGAITLTASILASASISFADQPLKKYQTNENIYHNKGIISLPEKPMEKQEELRSTWISTVYNLDFPSKKAMTEAEFKAEFIGLLNNVQALNLNSIIFQVRPKGDAFYESDINPWSEFLTGIEDKSPGWDPMEWMVAETHKRGLEFEAWFNPYRVTTSSNKNTSKAEDLAKLSNRNFAKRNPDKVFKYEGKLYLNPGEPEVINYINQTIMEVVNKYNIDGVHLDDYFYPSRRQNIEGFYANEEALSYNKYKGNFTTVANWRRNNVDQLVEKISKSLGEYNKNNNKNIKFGISPFGIWGHKANHLEGSNTPPGSMESYLYQFADTRKWVKEGWLDYIAPQIYWSFDEKAAPYAELVNWWSDTVKGTGVDLYIGHGNYRQMGEIKNQAWKNPREISNQLKYNSQLPDVKGSIFFRYKSLLKGNNKTSNEFIDILRQEHYTSIVSPPTKEKLLTRDLGEEEISVEKSPNGNTIKWKDNNAEYYIVYREEIVGFNNMKKELLGTIYKNDMRDYQSYLDESVNPYRQYRYSVVAIN